MNLLSTNINSFIFRKNYKEEEILVEALELFCTKIQQGFNLLNIPLNELLITEENLKPGGDIIYKDIIKKIII